jgi:hypothetical protein
VDAIKHLFLVFGEFYDDDNSVSGKLLLKLVYLVYRTYQFMRVLYISFGLKHCGFHFSNDLIIKQFSETVVLGGFDF